MQTPRMIFAFDLIDPGSYLTWTLLRRRYGGSIAERVRTLPLELRPPPQPFLTESDEGWKALAAEMSTLAHAAGVRFSPPAVAPWSRKALELVLHAVEKEMGAVVIDAVFEARFVEGLDIGRVDLLIRLAGEAGLDAAEARTVLGVDGQLPAIEQARARARELGIQGVPTLLAGGERLEGFRSEAGLYSFLDAMDLTNRGTPDARRPHDG
jgi:predicted DsbA family dithiol-disulfide isomerase